MAGHIVTLLCRNRDSQIARFHLFFGADSELLTKLDKFITGVLATRNDRNSTLLDVWLEAVNFDPAQINPADISLQVYQDHGISQIINSPILGEPLNGSMIFQAFMDARADNLTKYDPTLCSWEKLQEAIEKTLIVLR